MNLVWMAALALLCLVEKTGRHGARVNVVVGSAVLVYPDVLPLIGVGMMPSASDGSMRPGY